MGAKKKQNGHGGILLLPPCQIAKCRGVVGFQTKRNGGSVFEPPLGYVDERTKLTCPATVFFFPRRAGQAGIIY